MTLTKISSLSVVGTRGYFTDNGRLDMYFVSPPKIDSVKYIGRVAASRRFDITDLEDLLETRVEKGVGIKEDVGDVHAIVPGCLTSNFVIDLGSASKSCDYSKRKQIVNRDILLLADAHSTGYIGKNTSIAILNDDEKAIYIGHLIRLRPDKDRVNPFYLLAYLNYRHVRLILQYSVRGQSVGLFPNDIRDLPVILPPRDVQDSIGDKLTQSIEGRLIAGEKKREIDRIFAKYLPLSFSTQNDISYTYTKRESHLINKRLDSRFYHPKYRDIIRLLRLTKLPTRTLKEIVSFSSKTFNPKKLLSKRFRYVEIDNIETAHGYIAMHSEIEGRKAPSRAKKVLREGDLLVSLTRPYRGAIAVVDTPYDNTIGTTGFSVLRSKTGGIDTYYLCPFLRTRFGLMQLEQRMSNANYPAVIESDLEHIIVPLLPDSERDEISANMKLMVSLLRDSDSRQQEAISELERVLSVMGSESQC